MLLTLAFFLIIAFFIEAMIICGGIALKDRAYLILHNDMIKSMNSTKPGVQKTWDLVQQEFQCCGFNGPSDWKIKSNKPPMSCCKNQNKTCPSETNPAFVNGCYEALIEWFANNISIVGLVALIILIVQIFGTTLACLLARSIKKGYQLVTN
jgi:hypothetical protein